MYFGPGPPTVPIGRRMHKDGARGTAGSTTSITVYRRPAPVMSSTPTPISDFLEFLDPTGFFATLGFFATVGLETCGFLEFFEFKRHPASTRRAGEPGHPPQLRAAGSWLSNHARRSDTPLDRASSDPSPHPTSSSISAAVLVATASGHTAPRARS